MNKKKEKSNAQIYLTFGIVIVISMFVGGIAGGMSSYFAFHIKELTLESVCNALNPGVFIVTTVFEIILFITAMLVYGKCKKQADAWDGEDEDVIKEIELNLNYPIMIQSVMMIVGFFSFPICEFIAGKVGKSGAYVGFLSIITFIVIMVMSIGISKITIDLEKKLNPEKRGNVFQFDFKKTWEKSCDEAELIKIGKASKSGMNAGTMACLILWVVCVLATDFFDGAVFGVIVVCAIWLTMQLAYCIKCIKLDK